MTLALLITAVGGAWAEESESITTTLPEAKTGSVEFTGTHFKITGQRADTDGMNLGSSTNRTITISALNGEIITKVEMTISFKFYSWEWEVLSTKGNVSGEYTTGKKLTLTDVDVSEVTLSASNTTTGYLQFNKFKIFYTMPAGTMTLNADNTEATMEMPASDVTADYELVRDMSVQMQAQVGDGTDGVRYRVQWNDEKDTFEPAEMDYEQVMALFSVYDDIEEKKLTANTDYTVQLYAVDDEGNPTGDAMDFTNFTFAPGRYYVTASAQLGAPYDGTTAPSNIFELYEGYEVVVPAKEFITYYKDEPLYVEDEDAVLYTITSVSADQAVLSEKSDAMPSNTPMLVYNKSNETKTILLIPCAEPNLAITWADEFIGTLTEKTFSDEEMGAGDFYVCNGKEFIKVRGAGTLAANKAYLKVTGNAPASIPFRRSIDGGEGTTGIDAIDNAANNDANATWYDLNGRKLNGKPAQKGIYIKNGKKIVVK